MVGRNEFTLLREEMIDGNKVNDCGRMDDDNQAGFKGGVLSVFEDGLLVAKAAKLFPNLNVPVSTKLRDTMIMSMSHSWNRSTTSAHVSWKRFSFSNFLNTVDFISTN